MNVTTYRIFRDGWFKRSAYDGKWYFALVVPEDVLRLYMEGGWTTIVHAELGGQTITHSVVEVSIG